MDAKIKRKYNLTYRAKNKGIRIDGYRHWIIIAFDEVAKLLTVEEAVALIKEYNFEVRQDKQLKFNF